MLTPLWPIRIYKHKSSLLAEKEKVEVDPNQRLQKSVWIADEEDSSYIVYDAFVIHDPTVVFKNF